MRNIEKIKDTPNLVIKKDMSDKGLIAFGGSYFDRINNKWLNFIFSYQMGWEHLSVSMPSKTPSWDQMCMMKEIFWDDEEEAFEYHPKKSEYVNIHPHCLHIWRPVVSDAIKPYVEQGMVTPGKILTGEDMLSKYSEEEKKQIKEIMEKEGIKDIPSTQLYDNVPIELIEGLRPPYMLVGTKTREGFDALKNMADANGIKINNWGD